MIPVLIRTLVPAGDAPSGHSTAAKRRIGYGDNDSNTDGSLVGVSA